ncbi:indigoidine synthase A-like protein involved in pigment biosynthesis [Legionella quinlivanii]|uniref:Pseudouridine-5'-phosphate glycosidase n=1 Tax=Legionella quinlivanii TaxID=45073 RepID=A0A0W0XN25_9GAMM|nr:pseudouridine-5'-phosphate glycosidase [Legionella quinlivanii]KTD46081.1 indigoidine synthase A-like protein involved in pigment biosynthesis [Legionella quinlivanii]MCW8451229.1 pseudouridine-5'-phosphate glycosidase [Legionella quinlivanii]SEG29073.1 pseudouridine-5'-phosphate glycosidase [Legionella quinlivanii DSM 21216]STY10578.1 indigoidine synthase A-like protein involved in pigment biosynthesis [Legionella quinlivanii]
MFHKLLQIDPEVADAIINNEPVVVLESTLISHGMPYPENLETACIIEDIIRTIGAIPATIALHGGRIHIGTSDALMEELAQSPHTIKASRSDIAYVLSRKLTASTTVAATMFCAHLAGLPIFVTGGIGGVHQQVIENFDISADLIELSTTPVTVVCSGAKSILDLPKTLEKLESYGVPIVGYRTNEFPAFYSHSSGLPLVHRLDKPQEIAELLYYQHQLGMRNGIVVANPIPRGDEIPEAQINPVIQQARAEAKGLQGKSITPFLLKRINELTAGESLRANIELIKNNASLGAQIAICYYQQLKHLNI